MSLGVLWLLDVKNLQKNVATNSKKQMQLSTNHGVYTQNTNSKKNKQHVVM